MKKTILEAIDLSKSFQMDETVSQNILKNINLEIYDKEFVTIMGPSGCGKSTLLYNISGMDELTSGKVIFDGQVISEEKEKKMADLRLKKMGFIFQQPHFLKNLNILDNILLPGYSNKSENKRSIRERGETLTHEVGIEHIAHKEISKVSGGELQRAGICRALINQPRILFGDEPTGALNSKATNDVLDLLNVIHQKGTTILLVTHNVKVAARSQRVIYMRDGMIIDEKEISGLDHSEEAIKEKEMVLGKWLINLDF
ncbi:MAG TPA: ABC transporter ATP-binding protein [Clostridia bacterium]|nr:ABC transporter ATP-binding protein [Clostridia bacterium]